MNIIIMEIVKKNYQTGQTVREKEMYQCSKLKLLLLVLEKVHLIWQGGGGGGKGEEDIETRSLKF